MPEASHDAPFRRRTRCDFNLPTGSSHLESGPHDYHFILNKLLSDKTHVVMEVRFCCQIQFNINPRAQRLFFGRMKKRKVVFSKGKLLSFTKGEYEI